MAKFSVGQIVPSDVLNKLMGAGAREQAFLEPETRCIFICAYDMNKDKIIGKMTVKAFWETITMLSIDFGKTLGFDVPVPHGQLAEGNTMTVLFINADDWTVLNIKRIALNDDINRLITVGNDCANNMSIDKWFRLVQSAYTGNPDYQYEQRFKDNNLSEI